MMHTFPSTALPLNSPISILLVDDCPTFRQGLKSLLDFYSATNTIQLQVIGQAASVKQASSLALQQSPMLILLDMELNQESGLELLLALSGNTTNSKVLILSGHEKEEWVFKAMQAGAKGYVFKHRLSLQLIEANVSVLSNKNVLNPEPSI